MLQNELQNVIHLFSSGVVTIFYKKKLVLDLKLGKQRIYSIKIGRKTWVTVNTADIKEFDFEHIED